MEIIAYRTPYVSNACDAYRELCGRMKNGAVIYTFDNPGVSVKAESLSMRTAKGKDGTVTHEIQAIGALASRRQYPQKPTSGLIDEE